MADSIPGISTGVVAVAALVTAAPAGATAATQSGAAAAPVAVPAAATQELHATAAALNKYVQDQQLSLHFQVDKVTGQMVLSVIDAQTRQVLLQVPGQEALAIAQSLQQLMKPNLMDKTA
jgi:flagellar protein FlaG